MFRWRGRHISVGIEVPSGMYLTTSLSFSPLPRDWPVVVPDVTPDSAIASPPLIPAKKVLPRISVLIL
jgi:hypothetical protein